MLLISSASADANSYQHSSTLFEPLLHWLLPKLEQSQIETIHHLFRKCGHLTEFAILSLLLWRAIRQPSNNEDRPWNWAEAGLAISLVFLYAASDELHQAFVPSRTPLVSDVIIDTTGGMISLLILWLAKRFTKNVRK